MKRNLLLISNSKLHGSGYLDHCAGDMQHFLKNKKNVVFIPYARPSGMTYDEYTNLTRDRLKKMGFDVKGIHEEGNPKNTLEKAECLFIGGGNTFLLLKQLYESEIIDLIREKVKNGMYYMGSSAGSNVACKNIKTTNDMPIVYPPSFKALNLVPFNINPHYLDPDPNSTHKGETRETRIKEFHFYNQEYVVGLREGAVLHINDDKITLKGKTGGRVFEKDKEPEEYKPGDDMSFLLE